MDAPAEIKEESKIKLVRTHTQAFISKNWSFKCTREDVFLSPDFRPLMQQIRLDAKYSVLCFCNVDGKFIAKGYVVFNNEISQPTLEAAFSSHLEWLVENDDHSANISHALDGVYTMEQHGKITN